MDYKKDKYKACPVCGSSVEIRKDIGLFCIQCTKPHCIEQREFYTSEKEAIEVWNKMGEKDEH